MPITKAFRNLESSKVDSKLALIKKMGQSPRMNHWYFKVEQKLAGKSFTHLCSVCNSEYNTLRCSCVDQIFALPIPSALVRSII